MGSRRLVKYISDSIASLSSMMLSMSSGSRPPVPDDGGPVPLGTIGTSEKPASAAIPDVSCDGSVVLKRTDYERLCSELSSSRAMMEALKRKEEECSRMLSNYDATLTYVLERNEKERILLESTVMSEEIERLKSKEHRLRSYIQALKRDLFANEDKMESLRKASEEKIESLAREVEGERSKVSLLGKKLKEIEASLGTRCSEMVELIEYCKYLLR